MKSQLQSKTVWVSILVGLVSLLSLFGVIDTKDLDLSPDAAWVGIAWSLIQYVLRLVTKDSVKKPAPTIKLFLILLMPVLFMRCTGSEVVMQQISVIDSVGTKNIEEIIHASLKTYSGVKSYQEGADVLNLALSVSSDFIAAVDDADQAVIELKSLTDSEIINLVSIIDKYDISPKYKERIKAAFKIALFVVQAYYVYTAKNPGVTFNDFIGENNEMAQKALVRSRQEKVNYNRLGIVKDVVSQKNSCIQNF